MTFSIYVLFNIWFLIQKGIGNSVFRMYKKNSGCNYIKLHLAIFSFANIWAMALFFLFAFISHLFERVESSKILPLLNQLKLAVIVDAQSVTDSA